MADCGGDLTVKNFIHKTFALLSLRLIFFRSPFPLKSGVVAFAYSFYGFQNICGVDAAVHFASIVVVRIRWPFGCCLLFFSDFCHLYFVFIISSISGAFLLSKT